MIFYNEKIVQHYCYYWKEREQFNMLLFIVQCLLRCGSWKSGVTLQQTWSSRNFVSSLCCLDKERSVKSFGSGVWQVFAHAWENNINKLIFNNQFQSWVQKRASVVRPNICWISAQMWLQNDSEIIDNNLSDLKNYLWGLK